MPERSSLFTQRIITSNTWFPAPDRSVIEVLQHVPVLLPPEMAASEARRMAHRAGAHHLPVVSDLGECLGVVCRCALASAPEGARVEDVMSSPALSVSSDTSLEEAAQILLERGVGCLPVLYDSTVVGVLSRAFLAQAGLLMEGAAPRCVGCGSWYHLGPALEPGVPLCRRCREEGTRSPPPGRSEGGSEEPGFGG